jgi:hypothetical protein
MSYKSNRKEIAERNAQLNVSDVMASCTPTMCPMFHVYGGDCCHMMEAEGIQNDHEYNWEHADAHVMSRVFAFNPGDHRAHVDTWRDDDCIPF